MEDEAMVQNPQSEKVNDQKKGKITLKIINHLEVKPATTNRHHQTTAPLTRRVTESRGRDGSILRRGKIGNGYVGLSHGAQIDVH